MQKSSLLKKMTHFSVTKSILIHFSPLPSVNSRVSRLHHQEHFQPHTEYLPVEGTHKTKGCQNARTIFTRQWFLKYFCSFSSLKKKMGTRWESILLKMVKKGTKEDRAGPPHTSKFLSPKWNASAYILGLEWHFRFPSSASSYIVQTLQGTTMV